jgi:hypothetical protein
MRWAEGGKIETVLYSAACGALSSSEYAGEQATNGNDPTSPIAKPKHATIEPPLRARWPLFASPIRHHIHFYIRRKLSQRFRDSNTGGMMCTGTWIRDDFTRITLADV